jgi:hypothetical protein
VKRPPTLYLVVLIALVAVAALATLMYFGVPPFDNLTAFLLFNATSLITLLVAAVVGGAFVGMLLAQRILGNREFSPFERSVLTNLAEIRERLDALEKRDEEARIRR